MYIDRSYKVYWAKTTKIIRMSGYSQIWMILFKVLLVATIVVVISSGMYKLYFGTYICETCVFYVWVLVLVNCS